MFFLVGPWVARGFGTCSLIYLKDGGGTRLGKGVLIFFKSSKTVGKLMWLDTQWLQLNYVGQGKQQTS